MVLMMNKILICFLASASLLSPPAFAMELETEPGIQTTSPKRKPSKLELEQLRSPSCQQTDWSYHDFRGCEFEGVDLKNCNFTGCDFSDVHLANCNWNFCNFTDTNFTKAEMYTCFFQHSNFTKADLTEASISGNMEGANFTGSNFTDAWLQMCFIPDANITNTNFTNADLRKASILNPIGGDSANFTNAKLDKSKGIYEIIARTQPSINSPTPKVKVHVPKTPGWHLGDFWEIFNRNVLKHDLKYENYEDSFLE